jgi:hypothetical protein
MSINPKQLRPWWLKKRVVFTLAFPVLVLAAAGVAYVDSDTSSIVVYDETGHALPPLLVQACGQTRTFTEVEDQNSICFRLKPSGNRTPVHLELAGDPPWTWDGPPITPTGGVTVTVRLWPNHQVENYLTVSWWRELF